jgi:hypothetical protein
MDSVLVTNPLNIKSMQYFHGLEVKMEADFLVGDNFIYSAGQWKFLFYGRRVVNDLNFTVFTEQKF